MEPTYKPVELSFPVPRHLHMNLQAHLTFLENCSMVHLTTSTIGEGASTHAPLGSFVYAMPDVSYTTLPRSSPLADQIWQLPSLSPLPPGKLPLSAAGPHMYTFLARCLFHYH